MTPLFVALTNRITAVGVSLDPSAGGLPGSGTLQSLINGVGFWALLAALARTRHRSRDLGARRPHEQLPKR